MKLERLQLGLTAGVAATCFVSIFAAQLLLALACSVYVARLVLRRAPLPRLPTDAPVLAFVVWTLLSASFSADPLASHEDAKKLVLFALLPLGVDTFSSGARRERLLLALLLGSVALGGDVLAQWLFLGFDSLEKRPSGFLGHYMTAAGLMMGLLVVAAARVLRAPRLLWPTRRDGHLIAGLMFLVSIAVATRLLGVFASEAQRLFVVGLALLATTAACARGDWPDTRSTLALAMLAAPVTAAALVASRTRSAWVGALAGLLALGLLRAPRALWLAAALVAGVVLVRPAAVVERLTLSDASSRDRYYMWHAGIDMIRDKPVFGQGPGQVGARYAAYRWPQAPNPEIPHLHDNALQIAAERGLPAAVFWVWFIAVAARDAWLEARRQPGSWEGAATLALLAAVMAAGLFEYNFGDSEILMALLLVTALPYALRRERQAVAVAA